VLAFMSSLSRRGFGHRHGSARDVRYPSPLDEWQMKSFDNAVALLMEVREKGKHDNDGKHYTSHG